MKGHIEILESLRQSISSEQFDLNLFRITGVFVVRRAFPEDVIKHWQAEWKEFYEVKLSQGRNVNKFNPVALNEELPARLAVMYNRPEILNVAKIIFGNNVALYNHRFVIKDKFSPDKVFLHQDSCYHLGNLNKCSFFIPLSEAGPENGSLTFHLGSHKLGFLGDAGEINPDAFDFKWPTVTPVLNPGDFVVMNSNMWHQSGPNKAGIDRIMADTILQPADDPTGKELLCGDWETNIFYSSHNCSRYFLNSRILKILKFQKENLVASK